MDELLDPIQISSLREGSHPYRLILGDVRQRLVNTKHHMACLLVDSQEKVGDHYETGEELASTLKAIYESLKDSGSGIIADGRLTDLIRRVNCFGLSLMKLDIRQQSARHVKAMDEICNYLGLGNYSEWTEETRIEFLVSHLINIADTPLSSDERAAMESTVDHY